MAEGKLSESDSTPGRRILDGKPGVYMMKDATRDKALGYSRYVCLNDDGIMIRVIWELRTNRHDAVQSGNDQWIGRARSTYLVALWVQPVRISDLAMGEEVQLDWDAYLELRAPAPQLPASGETKGKGKGVQWPKPPVFPAAQAEPSVVDTTVLAANQAKCPGCLAIWTIDELDRDWHSTTPYCTVCDLVLTLTEATITPADPVQVAVAMEVVEVISTTDVSTEVAEVISPTDVSPVQTVLGDTTICLVYTTDTADDIHTGALGGSRTNKKTNEKYTQCHNQPNIQL